MWRVLMATALVATVLSAVMASAALLTVHPAQLSVFTYPVELEPVQATISKDLIAVNDEDGDGNIEVGERVEFTLRIAVENVSTDGTVTDVVVSDAFGGELEILSTTATVGDVTTSVIGKSEKPFLEWEVTWGLGQLFPGDQAELIVVAATDLNPGGHQEYTEAGPHSLNSGATLKAVANGRQFSVTSEAIWVEVVEANLGQSQGSDSTPSPVATTGDTSEYQVQPGDTLWHIATRFGTTVEVLGELNGLEDPDVILYGSTLNVPYVGEEPGDATADVSR
jgi:LysM repeat protein